MPVCPPSPLVAILGPTGSGKSEAGLALARRWPVEILNCDSVQIYRYLDIGAAKLRFEERMGVPHHFLDLADPDQIFTAGDYARRARPILSSIARAGKLPVVVGGTGFYWRALLDGLFEGPARDEALRARLAAGEARHPGLLRRLLGRLDPPSAARIHANDTNKLIRAVEVCIRAGEPLSRLVAKGSEPLAGFRPLKIVLDPPRGLLYQKLDRRARLMFEQGLIDEVGRLLKKGFPATSKAFESLGYRQALAVLDGSISLEEAIEWTQRDTRRYAKRQLTWFRKETGVIWIQGFGAEKLSQNRIIECVHSYLAAFEDSPAD